MRMRNRTKVAFLQLNRRDFSFRSKRKFAISREGYRAAILQIKPYSKMKGLFFYWEKSQIVFLRTNPCIFK